MTDTIRTPPNSGDSEVERYWRSAIPEESWHQGTGETLAHSKLEAGPTLEALPSFHAGGFAQYELHAELGRGGMGVVRHAVQAGLERPVAYKQLLDGSNAEHAELLRSEALITGFLEHPNIVPVHALGLDIKGNPAFVMKQVDGVEWQHVIEYPEVHHDLIGDVGLIEFHVQILMQVCRAAHFAHERGVVHRDIKPDNIFLGRYGEVYLMDWGLAAAIDDRMADRVPPVADTGAVVGTPAYMAPEMARPEDVPVGVWSDVYLLGASLFHVLTGSPPHAADTVARALWLTQREEAPEIKGAISPELVDICQRALAPEIAARTATAEGFRRELEGYLRHRSSRELTASATEKLEALEVWEDGAALSGTADEDTRVISYAADARVGFEEALRVWEGNTRARRGLAEVQAFGVRSHIRHGDLAAASALLKQMAEPEPALVKAVERLSEQQDQERARTQQLEQMIREQDPRVAAGSRAVASMLVPTVWAAMLVGLHYLGVRGTPLSWEIWLGQAVAAILICLPVTVLGRRAFLGTRLNRQLSASLYIGLLADLLLRATAFALGLSPVESVPFVMVGYGLSVGLMALFLEPKMMLSALLFGVLAPFAGWMSGDALLFFAAAVLFGLGPMSLVWRGPVIPRQRRSPPQAP